MDFPGFSFSKQTRQLRIVGCLNSLRFDNTRYKKISEQHEGSLEWLWTHPDYVEWSSAESSDLLLIEGKPGSGKSTLMKYFQQRLSEREPHKGQVVASFYYSYREGEQQTNHSNMLRSVLYDVLEKKEEFFYHFQPYYREATQGVEHPEWRYKSLQAILLSVAKNHPLSERLYLIVDAMDESDDSERADVIKLLRKLCAARGACIVKVFVASRPIAGLSGHPTKDQRMIRLQDVNYSDILKFTASFLGSPALNLPPNIADLATKYITENAQGVFVWVHLVKKELLEYAADGYTKNQIFDFLKSLPTELEGVYKRILMRLDGGKGQNIVDGQKMLQFVLFSYRSLGLDELGQALAIRDNPDSEFLLSDESFEGDLICGIEKRIISCAGNFLEIKARDDHGNSSLYVDIPDWGSLANRSTESSVVQVMHQTVREFFRPDGPTAQSNFRMKSNDAHMRISVACIRYLMLCASEAASIDQAAGSKPWTTKHFDTYARYLGGRPFFSYALEFAKRHLQQCGQVARDSELILQLSKKVNGSPAAYVLGNWIPGDGDEKILGHEQQDYSKRFRAELLHAVTRMGYPQVVGALLIAGAEIEASLGGKTTLMVAAESGSLSIARLLLDQEAFMEARDENKRTALHHAAANGHHHLVRLFLDRGAEVEAKDDGSRTALHLAAANGHDSVVRLVLDLGADKEARDDKGQTALHLTAANGHNSVMGLLIDRGANTEAENNEEQTALHLAAANGHNFVINSLVDRGANKEAKDMLGWGALHTAAWNGHEDTIKTLVQGLNAKKEGRDERGWTPLHVAAMNGRGTAIRCLIEQLGVDKDAKDNRGCTALHFVAVLGLGDTAELLIKTLGVDRDARNKAGETAQAMAQRWQVLWAPEFKTITR